VFVVDDRLIFFLQNRLFSFSWNRWESVLGAVQGGLKWWGGGDALLLRDRLVGSLLL
jgi:hypothetical protein